FVNFGSKYTSNACIIGRDDGYRKASAHSPRFVVLPEDIAARFGFTRHRSSCPDGERDVATAIHLLRKAAARLCHLRCGHQFISVLFSNLHGTSESFVVEEWPDAAATRDRKEPGLPVR